MYSLIFLAFVSFLVSFLLTPIFRDGFRSLGVLDHPNESRKIHSRAVPRIGGIPIAFSYVMAYGFLLLSPLAAGSFVQNHLSLVLKLLPSVGLIFATGLVDDLRGLKPWQKLVGQIAAAVLAFSAGARVLGLGTHSTQGVWSFAITIAWLIFCTNAFNLIDGIDGLAAGIGFFATLTTLVGALVQNHVPLALATAPLVGSLLAFLRYNFNPASIFLGDSGSLMIGFLLGCFSIIWSHKASTLLGMTAPLMVLAVPILEVFLSVTRRFISQRPIFSPDRGHIHHRLLDRGFSQRGAALVLYAVCGVAAIFSVMQSIYQHQFGGFITLIFCALTAMGIQYLRYAEFNVVRQMLVRGTFRRMLQTEVLLANFEQCLLAATNAEECWQAIRDGCKAFAFSEVQLHLAGNHFADQFRTGESARCSDFRILLGSSNYVTLTRECQAPVKSMGISPFLEVLANALLLKIDELNLSPDSVLTFPAGRKIQILGNLSYVPGGQ